MNLFAKVFFIGKWDPELGGRKLESRIQKGEKVPDDHLRAWRVAREEVLANIMRWIRLVIENYFAWVADKPVPTDRLLQQRFSDEVWKRIERFLVSLSKLPCWVDRNLSTTVFGPKQNLDYWKNVFDTGEAPNGVQILTEPLNLKQMIKED